MVERGRRTKEKFKGLVLTLASRVKREGMAALTYKAPSPRLAALTSNPETAEERSEVGAFIKETRDILSPMSRDIASNRISVNEVFRVLPQAGQLHRTLLPLERRTAHGTRPQIKAGTPQARATAGGTVAAITNQVASIPGQHGVPFRTKGNTPGQPRALAATPTRRMSQSVGKRPLDAPDPSDRLDKIRAYLRDKAICFRHAVGLSCKGCTFRHGVVPEGTYRSTALYTRRDDATERRQVAPAATIRKTSPAVEQLTEPSAAEASLNALTIMHGGEIVEDGNVEVSVDDTLAIPLSEGTGDQIKELELAAVQPGVGTFEEEEEEEEGNSANASEFYFN